MNINIEICNILLHFCISYLLTLFIGNSGEVMLTILYKAVSDYVIIENSQESWDRHIIIITQERFWLCNYYEYDSQQTS